MNKKEDLMRHSPGEKTDLKADLLKNSFILFFLLISFQSFGQIPINGFCSNVNYPIPKGYERVISADLNSSGNEELIFYSPTITRIGVYTGIIDENPLFKEFEVNAEISQLREIKNGSRSTNLYAAVDRKHRKIFLLEIYVDSIIVRDSYIEFDSYPENIFTDDIDLNNREEILVSGSGFDGLSNLSISDGSMGEQKIISGTSFSDGIFIDFNDDGFSDIAAFNILENSLQFFTNNTKGFFRLNRSIQYDSKISLLKTRDLNNDGISDLIYSSNTKIEILFGDFQGTFKEKSVIKLDERPTGIIFGDFNGDKILDISYTTANGTLNILFAKKESDFFTSITYLKLSPAGSITNFKSGGKDNIVYFLETPEIGVVTAVNDLNANLKIVPAIQAGALEKFDFGNDDNSDYVFVDEYDNYLKSFLVNKSGIPASMYYFPIAEDHKEIVVDDYYKNEKTFYCYSEGTPLLEVFRYNFKTNKLNRKQLYAPGEILDLNLQRVDSSLVNIFLAYNKQSKLYLGKFENRDVSVTFKEYPFIDRNVSLAKIRVNTDPEVYYWKVERDTNYFKMADIETGPNILLTYFTVPKTDKLSINLYGANLYSINYPTIVSIVQNELEKKLLLISGNKFSISKQLFNTPVDENKEFGRGIFGEIILKGIINFSVNTIDDDYINTLIYSEKVKSYSLSQTVTAENVSDYFFIKPNQKNYYLVYSNSEGELSIASVKK